MNKKLKPQMMDEFEAWANKKLNGIYRPFIRTENGKGYTNEYLNDCWEAWKAAQEKMKRR